MKIKLHENLPELLVSELSQLGHDGDTAQGEHVAGQADDRLWQAAQFRNRFLVTQNFDFSDMPTDTRGTHAGLLLVRVTHSSRDARVERVAAISVNEIVTQWQGCPAVTTSTNYDPNVRPKTGPERR